MDQPQELVSISAKILPKHLDYLGKFDKTNQSNALRQAIEQMMSQQNEEFLQKYLLLFALGLVMLALAPFMALALLTIIMYIIGVFYIGYSTTKIIRWRLKK